MDVLGSSLYSAAEILKVDSTLAVITFHSLEDIITKDVFHKLKSQETITPMAITKHFQTHKTIYPTKDEVEINKPSRSAKLRSITKKYEK
jgi:16S rRNA (cytosine1402-N4)-methyltransferase